MGQGTSNYRKIMRTPSDGVSIAMSAFPLRKNKNILKGKNIFP